MLKNCPPLWEASQVNFRGVDDLASVGEAWSFFGIGGYPWISINPIQSDVFNSVVGRHDDDDEDEDATPKWVLFKLINYMCSYDVCHVLSLSVRWGLVWVDRDGATPPGVWWGFEGKVETKDCCRSLVSRFRLFCGQKYDERGGLSMFVIISCHIISCHVDTGQMISESKGTRIPVFSSVMPEKLLLQVARQATGQKKAAALKEDKAGFQCCDVFSKATNTTPLFANPSFWPVTACRMFTIVSGELKEVLFEMRHLRGFLWSFWWFLWGS